MNVKCVECVDNVPVHIQGKGYSSTPVHDPDRIANSLTPPLACEESNYYR